MKTEFSEFHLEDWIKSDEDLVVLLNDALSSGNQKYLLQILGLMAKRKGMSEIAGEAATDRAHLYRLLSEKGNPSLEKFLQILKAVNVHLSASIVPPKTAV